MIRTLLTTTALTLLLTAGVIAQDAAPATPAPMDAPAAPAPMDAPAAPAPMDAPAAPAPMDAPAAPAPMDAPAAPAPMDAPAAAPAPVESGAPMETTDVKEPWDISKGYVAADTDNLGTRLIGQPVYSSTGDDAENIGDITDIVFDDNGQITAVVIGVGGFLGIGEKAVAIDFQSLEFTVAADNTERWVVPTTKDALTSAPDFVWADDKPADAAAPAADGGAMAPADTMTPAPAAQ